MFAGATVKRLLRMLGGLAMLSLVVFLTAAITFVIVPRLVNWSVLVVRSTSMEPALPAGGFALVEPLDAASIGVGDIVTFVDPGEAGDLVSHRVMAIEEGARGLMLRTKGDANAELDARPVPVSSVVGRVRFAVPWLGAAADGLRERPELLMLILLPGILVTLGGLGSLVGGGRRSAWRALNDD